MSLTLFGLAFAMSLYFQSVLQFTPAQAGLAFAPFAIGITVSNLAGGWMSARFGARVPIAGGLLLAGIGFLMLAGSGAGATYWSMFPAQIISRFGCGLAGRCRR